jgi:dethiobiotin synthase
MTDSNQIFVAATRQNDGKTMVSMGLFSAFQKRFNSVAYMKPVGQQYKMVDGNKIDKDAVLFQKVYNLQESLPDMSPIAVPRGFTEEYIQNGNKNELVSKVTESHARLRKQSDFLLIEGTGHAGVGSVFDMSNADTAKQLKSKVILVSLGGIGRAIDEIMLNKAVFDLKGVELVGVVINKIRKDKYDKVSNVIKQGLKRQNIEVFGCIPFEDMLIHPTVSSIFDNFDGEEISNSKFNMHPVEKFVIGDMVPHDALNHLQKNTLLIVPANREGLIMAAICGNILGMNEENKVTAIMFTGGKKPHGKVLRLIQQAGVPSKIVKEDSFTVATKITSMLVKVKSAESDKIQKIQDLVETYVDIDRICDRIS